jgi:hypothetical protein
METRLHHSTHCIPSLHGWESWRTAAGIVAGLDVIEGRPGSRIKPRIKEAERRPAPGDQEVVQESDDTGYSLLMGELDPRVVAIKHTGVEQLVPYTPSTAP